MPLYEYRCPGCGHRFEMLQRMGEGADGLACPRCGAAKVEKQFSTFASATSGESSAGSVSAAGGCGPGACGCGRW
jgi:putative FmdB family regulatory protein